jgi:hypothetical protein
MMTDDREVGVVDGVWSDKLLNVLLLPDDDMMGGVELLMGVADDLSSCEHQQIIHQTHAKSTTSTN